MNSRGNKPGSGSKWGSQNGFYGKVNLSLQNRPRRQGRAKGFEYPEARKTEVKAIRRIGACFRCRHRKQSCSEGNPCSKCENELVKKYGETCLAWRYCVRTTLAMIIPSDLVDKISRAVKDRGLLTKSVEDIGQGRELDFMIPCEWDHIHLSQYTAQWNFSADPNGCPVGLLSNNAFCDMISTHFEKFGPRLCQLYEFYIAASTLLFDYHCDYDRYKTDLLKEDAMLLLLYYGIAAIRTLDNFLKPSSLECSVERKSALFICLLAILRGIDFALTLVGQCQSLLGVDPSLLGFTKKEIVRLLSFYAMRIAERSPFIEDQELDSTHEKLETTPWHDHSLLWTLNQDAQVEGVLDNNDSVMQCHQTGHAQTSEPQPESYTFHSGTVTTGQHLGPQGRDRRSAQWSSNTSYPLHNQEEYSHNPNQLAGVPADFPELHPSHRSTMMGVGDRVGYSEENLGLPLGDQESYDLHSSPLAHFHGPPTLFNPEFEFTPMFTMASSYETMWLDGLGPGSPHSSLGWQALVTGDMQMGPSFDSYNYVPNSGLESIVAPTGHFSAPNGTQPEASTHADRPTLRVGVKDGCNKVIFKYVCSDCVLDFTSLAEYEEHRATTIHRRPSPSRIATPQSTDVPLPSKRIDCWGEHCFLKGSLGFKMQYDMEEHFNFSHRGPIGDKKRGRKILSLLI